MTGVRVFLLDDHEIVRRGLTELLELEGDIQVVGESGSAEEARRRIPAVDLPDGSGIDVCRHVRALDASIAGLILTSFNDEAALAAAVDAGAAGYLIKDVRGRDLVDTIRRVAAGERLLRREYRLDAGAPTVKNYITATLPKLGMERRTQAAVFAAKHPNELCERPRL